MESGIEYIEFEGLVTMKMFDGTEIQTIRSLRFQVDVNGPDSVQFVSHMRVPEFTDEAEPYGLVDSDNPIVRRFADRVMEIIAAPSVKGKNQCFDVPARLNADAAD